MLTHLEIQYKYNFNFDLHPNKSKHSLINHPNTYQCMMYFNLNLY